jgi:hypothetical protein
MPLIQVRLVEGSFVPIQKKEIVRKLAEAIRARKRASARPGSRTPLGVNGASAAVNNGLAGPLTAVNR